MSLIYYAINFYELLIVAYCLLSWFPIPASGIVHDFAEMLNMVCAPWLGLFRRYIPPMGGVDFSPVVAVVALSLIQRLVLAIL